MTLTKERANGHDIATTRFNSQKPERKRNQVLIEAQKIDLESLKFRVNYVLDSLSDDSEIDQVSFKIENDHDQFMIIIDNFPIQLQQELIHIFAEAMTFEVYKNSSCIDNPSKVQIIIGVIRMTQLRDN